MRRGFSIYLRDIHTHSLHLLKKSGANRKQAYADREELTDRRASYKKEERKHPSVLFIDAKCAPTGSSQTTCVSGGCAGVNDSCSSPHLPEAPRRAHLRSWTENEQLWPALRGKQTNKQIQIHSQTRFITVKMALMYVKT